MYSSLFTNSCSRNKKYTLHI